MFQRECFSWVKLLFPPLFASLVFFLPLSFANDPPHDEGSSMNCVTCHDMTAYDQLNLIPVGTFVPGPPIDYTLYNFVCWGNCHVAGGSAVSMQTHSSLQTDNGYGDWTVECWVCHNQHIQQQNRTYGTNYGKFIRTKIDLANISGLSKSGRKNVKFIGPTGPNSFADGDPIIDGICEVCHTQTMYHQNSSAGDHTHFSGQNCINCHHHTSGFRPGEVCLDCHYDSVNNRTAIGQQFNGNSHHIQGIAVTSGQCYQCHWEADPAGKITSYHAAAPGASVDLVIRDIDIDGIAAGRPTTDDSTTVLPYTVGVSTSLDLNPHCLGCHNEDLNGTDIFSDGKSPNYYAWDGNSVDARYSQPGTTPWGKYSSTTYPNVTPKDQQAKAFSAHGNAVNNEGGWDLNETWTNTRNGGVNVACFDCHNSHGSIVDGITTTYPSGTTNGGILKNTVAGKGGYTVDYQPVAGGSASNKNLRNAGASFCFDCHLSADGSTDDKPWGFQATFGEAQAVIGYFDSPFLAPGTAGTQLRYPYKGLTHNVGGHFGASSPLASAPLHQINGLCASCHDPHGVSPTDVGICSNTAYVTKSACQSGAGIWTSTPQYGVPILKGTWMTSPYKEDAAPVNNAVGTVRDSTYPLGWDATPREGVSYHLDQNTFGANIKSSVVGVSQTANQFAGLCLGCHSKNSLTDGTNGGTWKSADRIHESVKGWSANVRHNYTCAKCHTPHNGSALPRLMTTNCLNMTHKGRSGNNTTPVLSGSGDGDDLGCYGESVTLGGCPTYPVDSYNFASGGGRFPGSFNGFYFNDHFGLNAYTVSCHESQTGSTFDQSWNDVTAWTNLAPSIISGPSTGNQLVLMHMDEASWNGTPNEVNDSSGLNNHGTAYNGTTTTTGGISGNAGNFNGSNNYVGINYSPPVDNFTIEAWIKPTITHEIDAETITGTGGTLGQRYLFGADHRGAEGGAGISAGTNGISVYEHGASYMPALAVYSGTISSTQWTHIAVVYANKKPSIYVNGVLVRTGLTSPRTHVYAPTRIGGGTYGYFPGTVDEVALYNGALSAADILQHYQQQSSIVCNITGVDITWTTDNNTTSYVDYGLTPSYGETIGNDTLVKNHSVLLTGLTPSAIYHYRVRSSNNDGEAVSSDYTFTINDCL